MSLSFRKWKVPFCDDNLFKPDVHFLTKLCTRSWALQYEYHFHLRNHELCYTVAFRPFGQDQIPGENLRRFLVAYTELFVQSIMTVYAPIDLFDTLLLESMLSPRLNNPKRELDLDFHLLSVLLLGRSRSSFRTNQILRTYHVRTTSEIYQDLASTINDLRQLGHGDSSNNSPWDPMMNVVVEALLGTPRSFRGICKADIIPFLGYAREEEEIPWIELFDIMGRPQEQLEAVARELEEDEDEEPLSHLLGQVLSTHAADDSEAEASTSASTGPDDYAAQACSSMLLYLAAAPTLAASGTPHPEIYRDVGYLVNSIFEVNPETIDSLVIRIFILLRRFYLDQATWPLVEEIFLTQVGKKWEDVLASVIAGAN